MRLPHISSQSGVSSMQEGACLLSLMLLLACALCNSRPRLPYLAFGNSRPPLAGSLWQKRKDPVLHHARESTIVTLRD
ncbi:hypothetical protein GE09DRAFT_1156221 [Coniochaeta sp. 2T2.1]|nr:hypothetical protein GE09DRAFT_1156221 [Coniochaeta sp. 2T2.1]